MRTRQNHLGVAGVAIALLASATIGAEPGLVAHYRFDEGSGTQARDSSGRGNHATIHGAAFVKLGRGYVLKLDGKAAYVDGGVRPDFEGESGGAFELWFKPRALQGGLVNWSTGGGWKDIRLTLAFNTYGPAGKPRPGRLLVNTSDGEGARNRLLPLPKKNAWTHMAVSFDGSTVTIFVDGRQERTFSQGFRPKRAGIPLWIGRCQGLGAEYFKGLIDEVRIYNRPITAEEVLVHYKQRAREMGKDVSYFDRPKVQAETLAEPGWILVDARYGLMRPIPSGAILQVSVRKTDGRTALVERSAAIEPEADTQTIKLDAAALAAGDYQVQAALTTRSGQALGRPSTAKVNWPGRAKEFQNVKVLNNLVWELVNTSPGKLSGTRKFTFNNPKRRWGFVSCTAEVADGGKLRISLKSAPSGDDMIVLTGKTAKTLEAMRPLRAGRHTLIVEARGPCEVQKLVVRSIPELIYARWGSNPHVKQFGPYPGAFLDKYVLPNLNTLVLSAGNLDKPVVKRWRQRGGRWLVHCGVPKYRVVEKGEVKLVRRWSKDAKYEPLTPEDAAGFIAKTPGFADPRADGSIADEFGNSDVYCAAYAGAVRKLAASPQHRGRLFYPYANHLYTGPEGIEFVKALLDTGSAIAWKRYLKTQSDVRAARAFLKHELVDRARAYRHAVPRALECIAVCFGYFSEPNEFLNTNPSVNYKKYLDMQFNLVADDPAFWGTYGLMTYLASYADEETVRWAAHLFRYYGIEGKRAPALDEPHDVTYLRNGDFAKGTSGWTLEPAEKDSIRTVTRPGFGWLQGRYPRTPEGDTALLMVRSNKRPNAFSQQIKGLVPGRLYSFRMFTGDFEDLSKEEVHAVTVKLDNVELIPGKTITHVGHNCYSHRYGPFNRENKAWFNYHWRVFRAKGSTAQLTVSDWAKADEPGGRIGQQLMYNFVQVQSYFPAGDE